VLSILADEGPPETVIFHSYSGDVAMTERCVAAGYVLSFSGTVTFRNAPALRESAVLGAFFTVARRDGRAVSHPASVPWPAE